MNTGEHLFVRICYPPNYRRDGREHVASRYEEHAADVKWLDPKPTPPPRIVEVCTLDYLDIPQFLRRSGHVGL